MKTLELTQKVIPLKTIKRLQKVHQSSQLLLSANQSFVNAGYLANISGIELHELLADMGILSLAANNDSVFSLNHLIKALEKFVKVDNDQEVIITGTRERLNWLLETWEFAVYGFRFSAIFLDSDLNPFIYLPGCKVKSPETMYNNIKKSGITSAVLCSDYQKAQELTNKLVQAGITFIYNFSPMVLNVPQGVTVENVIPGYPKWRGKIHNGNLS
jgi:redox-sensing transcriptional repressor